MANALETQIQADQQLLAQADLAVLQSFQTIATTLTSTVGQMESAMAALPASLGDPGRVAVIVAMQGQYAAFLNQLATLISQANAIANPGA